VWLVIVRELFSAFRDEPCKGADRLLVRATGVLGHVYFWKRSLIPKLPENQTFGRVAPFQQQAQM
jgi:hypothetical protein